MECPKCGKEMDNGNCSCEETNKKENIFNKCINYVKEHPNVVKVIGGVMCAIALLIVFKNIIGNKSKGLTIDENALIIIKKDDKYGYINTNGKVVIEPTFEQASSFTGNYAIVYSDNKYKLIDKKGKVKFEVEYSSAIKYIAEYDVWVIDKKLYNGSLKQISKDKDVISYEKYGVFRWTNEDDKSTGLMNHKGKKIYTYKPEDDNKTLSVSGISADNTVETYDSSKYCIIGIEEKGYSIINCNNGKTIYKFTDNTITNDNGTIYEVKDKDSKDLIEKFIIVKNKIVYSTDKKDVTIVINNNYYVVKEDNEKYINKYTGKVTDKKPEELEDNATTTSVEQYLGYHKYKCDNKYGIKKDNTVKVECEWSNIKFFDIVTTRYLVSKKKYYALGKKDDKYYLINIKNGKVIDEFNTDSISTYSTSMFITYKDIDSNDKYVYNLVTGKSMKFDSSNTISLGQNYFTVKSDKLEYYNSKFKSIYTIEN